MTSPLDQVVHAVERTEKRRFAAPGRADQRHHRALGDLERDVKKRLLFAVPEGELADREFGADALRAGDLAPVLAPLRNDGGVGESGHSAPGSRRPAPGPSAEG